MDNTIEYTGRVHPKKFSLWLFCIGILMLFAGLTSAYIVRKGDGNWFNFALPDVFLVSTILVLLSSVTMYMAYRSAKEDELERIKVYLIATIVLGTGFIISQYAGWQALQDQGLYLVNPKEGDKVSASFFIVLTLVHIVHIVGGIFYLVYTLIRSFQLRIHKKDLLLVEMCNTYWHFIGLLWVYLYLFLYFAQDSL